MKRKIILLTLTIVALVLTLSLINAPASAAPRTTPGYTIDWYTIDSGGAMNLQGGSYTLSGTIGQPDAGTLSGGNYQLNSGFWGVVDSLRQLFLPLILR